MAMVRVAMEIATPEVPPVVPPSGGLEREREPLFRARALTKVYTSGEVDVRALDGVDLDLYPSELIVLLGASGSGKSTLLNNLGGLDAPTAGTLTYRGEDLTGADEDQLTRWIRGNMESQPG